MDYKRTNTLFILPVIPLNSALIFWYVGSYGYFNRNLFLYINEAYNSLKSNLLYIL